MDRVSRVMVMVVERLWVRVELVILGLVLIGLEYERECFSLNVSYLRGFGCGVISLWVFKMVCFFIN